jgi:hypothetical protein
VAKTFLERRRLARQAARLGLRPRVGGTPTPQLVVLSYDLTGRPSGRRRCRRGSAPRATLQPRLLPGGRCAQDGPAATRPPAVGAPPSLLEKSARGRIRQIVLDAPLRSWRQISDKRCPHGLVPYFDLRLIHVQSSSAWNMNPETLSDLDLNAQLRRLGREARGDRRGSKPYR